MKFGGNLRKHLDAFILKEIESDWIIVGGGGLSVS